MIIFLPVGHEESGLRRLPWITFGIMILCLLAFMVTTYGGGTADATDAKIIESARELFFYFSEHPYLHLDEDGEQILFPGLSDERRMAMIAAMRASARPPTDPAVLRSEQEELERLVRAIDGIVSDHPLVRYGLVPSRFSLLTLITHLFLHAGWFHLLGNMLMLYLSGPYIEDVWGRPLFASFYVLSGIVASLAFVLQHPHSDVPLVGASGAIAGVMGAFLVRYARTKITFLYWILLRWRGTFEAPAWLMLPLWFGQQIFYALMTSGAEGDGVAYLAHIAGFGFGVAVALGMRGLDLEGRYLNPRIESKVNITHVSNPTLDRAMALRAQGQASTAFGILNAEAMRKPQDRDVALALWDTAGELERRAECASTMERVIRLELRSGETDMACDHWLELREHRPRSGLEAAALVRLAQALSQRGKFEDALRAGRAALLAGGAGIEPALALKIARLSRGLDGDMARSVARMALSRPGLGPAERAEAATLAAEPPAIPVDPAAGA